MKETVTSANGLLKVKVVGGDGDVFEFVFASPHQLGLVEKEPDGVTLRETIEQAKAKGLKTVFIPELPSDVAARFKELFFVDQKNFREGEVILAVEKGKAQWRIQPIKCNHYGNGIMQTEIFSKDSRVHDLNKRFCFLQDQD